MRILIDLSHPAHVHLFRHAIRLWQAGGHAVHITAREKDITTTLLRNYGFEFEVASVERKGRLRLVRALLEHDFGVWRAARRFRPDVMLGTSVAIAHAGRLGPGRSAVFNEDDVASSPFFARAAYPFAHHIVTPDSLPDQLGRKHVTYPSYHELAYLHPARFTPDERILQDIGLRPGQFFSVLRFVSLKASHDIGQRGLSLNAKRELVRMLSARGPVFITSESPLAGEFEPHRLAVAPERIHDLLAFAGLFVGDSQSMAIEAAVLGTPALRCNTFVGRTPVIEEIQARYGLTLGFRPEQETDLLTTAERLLNDPDTPAHWQEQRARLLADKIDLTAWMVDWVQGLVE